jgi:hypothetical protein
MSSDVTKRTLSAGLGVGALALLARRASADTPFSSFAFPATGAPTARTLPDRLAEIKNVKDFGAKGNGTTDDAPAIRAALHSTRPPLSDPDTMANTPWHAGTIYFPAGVYRVASPISANEPFGEFSAHFVGSGLGTIIRGDMNDFVFKRSGLPFGIVHGNTTFSQLRLQGWGGILWECNTSVGVRDCAFECGRGVWFTHEIFGTIDNCQFLGAIDNPQNVAIYSVGSVGISNTRIQAYYHGVRCSGHLTTMTNLEIEVCRTGVAVGYDKNGADFPAGVVIQGCGFEGNGIGIDLNWVSNSLVTSCSLQGHSPILDNDGYTPGPVPIPGIHLGNEGNKSAIKVNFCADSVIQSVVANGWHNGHVIDLVPEANSNRVILMALDFDNSENTTPHPPVWSPIPSGYTVIACNNP